MHETCLIIIHDPGAGLRGAEGQGFTGSRGCKRFIPLNGRRGQTSLGGSTHNVSELQRDLVSEQPRAAPSSSEQLRVAPGSSEQFRSFPSSSEQIRAAPSSSEQL